jgi:Copper amine oxidase N-terminal domain.
MIGLLLSLGMVSAEKPSSPQLIHAAMTVNSERRDINFLSMNGRLYAPAVHTLQLLLPPWEGGIRWDNERKAVEYHLTRMDGILASTIIPAIVHNGRAFVPIRDAAAFFGYDVYWNQSQKDVTLRTLTSLDDFSQVDAAADPGAVKQYLNANHIPNGDIYLDEGKLHINIVGLTPATEALFERSFEKGTYELHDVTYTIHQLQQVQEALAAHDLYRKVNIYSSSIDVTRNRVVISMPDSAEVNVGMIEAVVDKDMLINVFEPLGEPDIIGQITEIDTKTQRILVSVDGEPSMWYSFSPFSEIMRESGEAVTFKDFKIGQTICGWNAGMVMTSLPSQGTARRIEIMEEPNQ